MESTIKSEAEEESAVLHDDVQVKQERADREPGLLDELYRDHEVKEELVIGPVVLQKPASSAELVSRGQTNLPQRQENTIENENCAAKDLESCLKAITSNKLVPVVVLERYSLKKTEQLKQRKTKATDVSDNQEVCTSRLMKTHGDKEEQERRKGGKLQRLTLQPEHIYKRISASYANKRNGTKRQTQRYSAEDLQLCLNAIKNERFTAIAASGIYNIPISTLYRILARDEDKPSQANLPQQQENSNENKNYTTKDLRNCLKVITSNKSLPIVVLERYLPKKTELKQRKTKSTDILQNQEVCSSHENKKEQGKRKRDGLQRFPLQPEHMSNRINAGIANKRNSTRQTQQYSAEDLQLCLNAVKTERLTTIAASVMYDIPISTLYRILARDENKPNVTANSSVLKHPYLCALCGHNIQSSSNLMQHKCTRASETSSRDIDEQGDQTANKFTCDICKKDFKWKNSLTQHIMHIHKYGNKSKTCKICNKQFPDGKQLNLHQRIHSGDKPYSCKMCNKKFTQSPHLIRHQRIHTGAKPYSCKICNKKFSDFSNLTIHRRYHSGDKPFSCKVCNKQFTQSPHLIRHQRVHTGDKPYSCTICTKTFSDYSGLRNHQRIHTGEKPYSCKICNKQFSQSSALITHRVIHTGDKPYSCEVCNKRFSQISVLTTHQRVHAANKLFLCKICNRQLSSNSALITHQRIHTGEKPYSCKICNKQFSQSSSLITHRRVHTADKPYSCEICGKQFSIKLYLNRHKSVKKGNCGIA